MTVKKIDKITANATELERQQDQTIPELQDRWEMRLYSRARRIGKLVELEAPEALIRREKEMFVKAVLELTPERLAKALVNMKEGIAQAQRDVDLIDTGDKDREGMI
jgi:hypothetical protein